MRKKTLCEMCHKDQPNCGPFRDDRTGQTWELVCGGCKARYVLTDPEYRARLERDVRAFAGALDQALSEEVKGHA